MVIKVELVCVPLVPPQLPPVSSDHGLNGKAEGGSRSHLRGT